MPWRVYGYVGIAVASLSVTLVGCDALLASALFGDAATTSVAAEAAFAQRPCAGGACDRDQWAVVRIAKEGVARLWPPPTDAILLPIPRDEETQSARGGDVRPADLRTAVVRSDWTLLVGTLGANDAGAVARNVRSVAWSNQTAQLAVVRAVDYSDAGTLEIWDNDLQVVARYPLAEALTDLSWSADDRYVAVSDRGAYLLEGNCAQPPCDPSRSPSMLVDLETGAVTWHDYPLRFVGARTLVSMWDRPRDFLLAPFQPGAYLRRVELVDGQVVLGDEIKEMLGVYDADPLTGVILFNSSDLESSYFDQRAFIALATAQRPVAEYVYVGAYLDGGEYVLVPRAAVAGLLGAE